MPLSFVWQVRETRSNITHWFCDLPFTAEWDFEAKSFGQKGQISGWFTQWVWSQGKLCHVSCLRAVRMCVSEHPSVCVCVYGWSLTSHVSMPVTMPSRMWACWGTGVWNAAECVDYVCFSRVCLCIVLYGCMWAAGITQRVHHIENQHTVGSQAHTKRVSSRSLLPLSLYLSLFLRKRSYI